MSISRASTHRAADKGHAHCVEDARKIAEYKSKKYSAEKDGQTVLPSVLGGEGHHGDGKNEHEKAFEHSAGLSVDQKQNAEDGNDHSSKS